MPYGYTEVTRARVGLIIGGGVTLGASYVTTVVGGLATAASGAFVGRNTDIGPFFIPVLGPFLEIGQADHSSDKFVLALLGLGQTAGVVMLVYGLTSPRTVLVRNDQRIVTSVAPMIAPGATGRSVTGLSVTGRF